MLNRLLSNQIEKYEDVINETIIKTIPEYQEKMKTELYNDLLLGNAQCWISSYLDKFDGVVITKIEKDIAVGGKTCTLISGYSPTGTCAASFYQGWEAVSKFAKNQDCDRISLYTNNPEVEKYLHMFDIIWETRYYQMRLNKEE